MLATVIHIEPIRAGPTADQAPHRAGGGPHIARAFDLAR
jgi:hypothetical protein